MRRWFDHAFDRDGQRKRKGKRREQTHFDGTSDGSVVDAGDAECLCLKSLVQLGQLLVSFTSKTRTRKRSAKEEKKEKVSHPCRWKSQTRDESRATLALGLHGHGVSEGRKKEHQEEKIKKGRETLVKDRGREGRDGGPLELEGKVPSRESVWTSGRMMRRCFVGSCLVAESGSEVEVVKKRALEKEKKRKQQTCSFCSPGRPRRPRPR